MAKRSSVEKQKRKEKLVSKLWAKREGLKAIANNMNVSEEERMLARTKLDMLPKNSAPTRLRNRCSMTGRPRGYLRKFKLSRLTFREMASHGLIPGVVKASW